MVDCRVHEVDDHHGLGWFGLGFGVQCSAVEWSGVELR